MRDSSLLFLEKPLEKDSLALIASTTTVLQMTEHGGNLNATLEVQVSNYYCTIRMFDEYLYFHLNILLLLSLYLYLSLC